MNWICFLWQLCRFFPYYVGEVLRANLRVIHDVVTSRNYARPGIVKFPLTLKKNSELFLLANLITMSPGTVCLDFSADRKYLFIHFMFYDGPQVIEEIRTLETRIGRVWDERFLF